MFCNFSEEDIVFELTKIEPSNIDSYKTEKQKIYFLLEYLGTIFKN